MIQFNLLPDVKLEYLRVRRTNRLVIGSSLVASAVALLIFLLLFLTVNVFQKKNMSDLTSDIKTRSAEVQKTPDISKIVTVQSQLNKLPDLHDEKALASRTFGYLQDVTPESVTVSELQADYTLNTLIITGQAGSLDALNTYVDTLKFTNYATADGAATATRAFQDVVVSEFSRSTTGTTFTVSLAFDPVIFSTRSDVKLTVPEKKITTRSEIEKPSQIFRQAPAKTGTGNQ